MKSLLVLTLALAPLACAGAEAAPLAPQAPLAPPVVVDLTPPPAPAAPRAAPPPPEAKPKEAEEYGMIGLLSSGGSGDPNAPTAPWGRDDDPTSAKGNMWGDSVGESFGAGGLGLSGVGSGSGSGVGLGSIGTLGHGASHKGAKVRMGATTVNGRLPPEVIQRIVRQNFGRFRLCYEKGLEAKPTLAGTVSVTFVIDESGAVTSVAAGAGTAMPDAKVTACVTRAFGGLSFPQPEGGKVSVVYPITFSPGEPAAAAKKP